MLINTEFIELLVTLVFSGAAAISVISCFEDKAVKTRLKQELEEAKRGPYIVCRANEDDGKLILKTDGTLSRIGEGAPPWFFYTEKDANDTAEVLGLVYMSCSEELAESVRDLMLPQESGTDRK